MNRHETHEDKPKGVFIPAEILESTTLNSNEKILFGFYHYYTLYGEKHCCFVLNEKIGQWLNMQERTIQRAKKHLLELGLIEVNGVIYVRTKGDKIDTHINIMGDIIDRGDNNDTLQGDKNDTPRVTKLTHRGDKIDTHIKEEKRNIKDIKEKVKRKAEVMEETTTNKPTNTSSNEVRFNEWDIFNDFHSTDGVTEGVINNRGMNKATQQTNTNKPSSCKGVEETVTPKTKTVVENGDSPYTYKPSSCKEKTNVEWSRSDYGDLPFCDDNYTLSETYSLPLPTATKTAPRGARNTASGTTTHTEGRKPAEGVKTPSFDLQTPFDRLDKIVERKKKEKTPSQFSAWLMFDFVGQFLFQTKCKVSRDDKRVRPYVEMIKSNAGLNDKEKASIIERITN